MDFTVTIKGSRWESNEDDMHTASDFRTEEDARKAYGTIAAGYCPPHLTTIAHYAGHWVVIEGPGWFEEARIPGQRLDDDSAWDREQAMQMGMGLGIDAYNDAMGW